MKGYLSDIVLVVCVVGGVLGAVCVAYAALNPEVISYVFPALN